MNDLQPLVDGRLEPVMEACQGQHLRVPVREERGKTSLFHKARAEEKAESPPHPPPPRHFKQTIRRLYEMSLRCR